MTASPTQRGTDRPLPLVGRDDEMAIIASLLREARQGSGKTLIVSGEGGVGKTRILAEAGARARADGWNVVTGRAYSVETGIPYALFADALLPSIRSLEPGALAVLTRGGAAELAFLFPALGSSGDRERAGAGMDAADFKARLLWNFTQFLGRLAAKQPLCLILENLQWADASSLELLHFVARQISNHPIALLVSYNAAERESNEMLRTTEQSLLKLGAASQTRIGPLTLDDVATIVTKAFNVDPSAISQFTALLYGSTRGNAFFVEETLKWLIESKVLRQVDGRWTGWEVESLQLPPNVRDAVKSRIDRLSSIARELATLAAVVGTHLTFDQIAALSPVSEAALADALDELCTQRVLVESPAGETPGYDFAHPILQQVAYSSLGAARARMLHADVAEALESFYGRNASDHAGELAFHFTKSRTFAPKAITYLSEAGRTALDTYANREAATYLTSALDELDNAGEMSADRDEIIVNLARARQRLGEYDEALVLWTRARDSARARDDFESMAMIEHRMGLASFWSGRLEDALSHYENGLEAARKVDDLAAIARLRLATGSCLQEMGRLDNAKAEVETALSVAEQSGDNALLARAHRSLLLLYAWTGPVDTSRDHGEKAIEFAEASGEAMLEWTAHWGMGLLAGLTTDGPQVLRHIAECQRLEEQLRSPLLPLITAEISIQYASGVGDWDAGIATGERTIALARTLRQRTLLPRLLVWTGLIYLWRGELPRARAYFDEAWQLSGAGSATAERIDVTTVVPAHMGLAAYYLETDNFAEAIRIGEAGLALADKLGYIAWSLQWILPVIGEAALWSRDFDRAERHSARMRRDAERLGHRLGFAVADACDGMLLLFRDQNWKDAIPLLERAIAELDTLPMPDVAARVRRVLAGAVRDGGDREGAIRELRGAHDTFARLGAAGELNAVRDELRGLGARPPSRTMTTGMAGLTGRETEIARMVSQRKSNKEIGTALDISARTVSTHLSNIFGKVGVASRGELADFVRNNSLDES
jgi:DNA-binding CsgD family transcriptional regulator/tetratricopeptide (TPR) repeat protein